jgi:uncharacterized protein (UPF0335 family)
MLNNDVLELVERLITLENEIKLLQEDKNHLFVEYKEKLDIKAFKAAIRIAKIKSKLGDSEITLEELLPAIESKICVN